MVVYLLGLLTCVAGMMRKLNYTEKCQNITRFISEKNIYFN